MIYFVPLDIELHWDFVRSRARCLLCEDTCGIVALNEHGAIQAAMIADSFTNTTCVTHFTLENPMVLRSGFMVACAQFLFTDRKRLKIFGMTPSDNPQALKFNKHIGWTEIYRIKDAYDVGVDYILQEMNKEDCRWLFDEHKEKEAS